jgi:O-antigen/teichoic acid export membrane protein
MRHVFKHWIFQGAVVMGAAMAVEAGTQFVRSIVLTRRLGPTEFGIAAAMVTLLALIDMSTYAGADRYLVQARDGDSSEALAAGHTLTLARNLLSAALIAALAYPTAHLVDQPQATTSFLWLAAIPLLRSFEHLRLEQLQREHRFWPWAMASSTTYMIGLISVTCAAFILRDHRAVLWGLAAQAVALVVGTHLFARTPYRVSFTAAPVARAMRFGIPLMINGLALAALGQFDRLAVGCLLNVAALGKYGLAGMVFYVPSALLMRVMVAVLQPRLAAAWHRSPRLEFPNMFRRINAGVAAFAALAGAAVAIIGDPLVHMLFGDAYAVGDAFFAFFSIGIFMRFAKTLVNFGGMAMGRTMDLMWSNIPMALGLLVTIVGLRLDPILEVAAVGAMVGETIGAGAAFALMQRDLTVAGKQATAPFLLALPLPVLAALWVAAAHPSPTVRIAGLALLTAGVALGALVLRVRAGKGNKWVGRAASPRPPVATLD